MCPVGDTAVELPHVPAMSRRRLGHLAKLAVSVADRVLVSARGRDIPVVWASRYGDAEKALSLLKAHALNEPMSPTAFGLSVHNAVGAQHAILRGMRANAVCVASSHCVPEAGVVEAAGLLNDMEEGAAQVLLVCYDERLPHDYAMFHDEPATAYAWAALIAPLQAGEDGFVLQAQGAVRQGDDPVAETPALPHGLDVLHFLLQARRHRLINGHASGQWIWERVRA